MRARPRRCRSRRARMGQDWRRAREPEGRLKDLMAALRKDLLLQWRGRAQVIAIFAFGAAALLLFSFAIGPDSAALREHAAGFLWLGLLLASTLALAESFELEMQEQALAGLLLLPAGAPALLRKGPRQLGPPRAARRRAGPGDGGALRRRDPPPDFAARRDPARDGGSLAWRICLLPHVFSDPRPPDAPTAPP